MFYAHIKKSCDDGNVKKQTILEHLRGTAKKADGRLYYMGYHHLIKVVALLHDTGKYGDKYQEYLEKIAMNIDVLRGSVNHTFAGVIYILEKYHGGNLYERLTSEIIAYACGAHHGLFDCVDVNENNGFQHRLDEDREVLEYDIAKERFLDEVGEDVIEKEFQCAVEEVKKFYDLLQNRIKSYPYFTNGEKARKGTGDFMCGLFVRMIASALMYGDRLDTAEFMQGYTCKTQIDMQNFWTRQVNYLEKKLYEMNLNSAKTPINEMRQRISDDCKKFAENGNGIYKISVPTGAGKTLSTLRYAYTLAEKEKKQRVIIVIPLLSVLDQNSEVIQEYTEAKEQIGEHHSNIVREENKNQEEFGTNDIVSEFWDEPIIITTMYQFLMNLFSDKTSAVTRMSSFANSVIVFDEIQSLPKKDINMFNMSMNFLNWFFDTTILLSSATQPELGKTRNPILYTKPYDIIPESENMTRIFKRTEVDFSNLSKKMTAEDIAEFCDSLISNVSSTLIICNTKEEAIEIYRAIKEYEKENEFNLFYLSTLMCPAHRKVTLSAINESLDKDKKCKTICVSTQMVEAGVDFSFETVIRIIAGLDNLIQSAGRCNRSYDYGHICKVFLVQYKNENLSHLQDIKRTQQSMFNLLQSYKDNPESLSNDIFSKESIKFYYDDLLNGYDQDRILDYPTKDNDDKLIDLVSGNFKYAKRSKSKETYFLRQAFKEAGRQFKVYDDDDTVDVIVPYKEGDEIIKELYSEKACYDIGYRKKLFRQAGQYSIKLWRNQLTKYVSEGIVCCDKKVNDFYTLDPQYYKYKGKDEENIGFVVDNLIF